MTIIAWFVLPTVTYLIAKGFWSAFLIQYRCPKRGDVIRYINHQNKGLNSWFSWGMGRRK